MKTSNMARPGDRVAPDWEPTLIDGKLGDVRWLDWELDPNRPLRDLALAYLRHCRDRKLALGNVETIEAVAARFIRFIETGKATKPKRGSEAGPVVVVKLALVGDLTTTQMYAYLGRPAERGGELKVGAQRSEGGTLRGLVEFGLLIGVVDPKGVRAFELPQATPAAGPSTLSDAEIRRLDRYLAATMTYEGSRLRLLCRLDSDTGLRPSELAAIKLADIDFETRSILVTGKGTKTRRVFYGPKTAGLLERYLRYRGQSDYPELFQGHRGPMGEEGLSKLFREIADEIGLVGYRNGGEEQLHPTLYILRRTFARLFADNGGKVEELAKLLGHAPSSIPMLLTTYYTPSDDRLRRAHELVRPLDRLFDEVAA